MLMLPDLRPRLQNTALSPGLPLEESEAGLAEIHISIPCQPHWDRAVIVPQPFCLDSLIGSLQGFISGIITPGVEKENLGLTE